ncbi:hypothetical protein KKF86_04065, partial [bacterium]|nr:hypothetical protein [bacterium]
HNPYLIIGIYLLSVILMLLPSLIFKIHANRLSTEELRKSKRALGRAIKKLKKSDGDQFTNTSNTVYGYLKDKMQLTSDKLDPLKVKSILSKKINDKAIIDNLMELLKTGDAGRFAPGGSVTRETLIKKTKTILKQLDAVL